MGISKKKFGVTKDGREVFLYTIKNSRGMEASITDFGAIVVKLLVPDRNGAMKDVVLGYDNLEAYEENSCFFGAVIGRNANRISHAQFVLDGQVVKVPANENGNNLHTDHDHGFHKVIWTAVPDEEKNAVVLSYVSPDGENGFPGTLHMTVTYTLLEDNGLEITYDGISDKKTVINVTNHSYFNLGGQDSGSICDERVMIHASGYTEILPGAIPTGRILPVEGTVMDFRKPRRVGESIDTDWEQLTLVQGYDHNWALDTEFGKVEKIAQVEDDRSGITMDVYTDLPGVQFYAGNCITPQIGKDGASYRKRHALCLETQYFPDSVNHPEFRQPVFEAGEKSHSTTIYKFR